MRNKSLFNAFWVKRKGGAPKNTRQTRTRETKRKDTNKKSCDRLSDFSIFCCIDLMDLSKLPESGSWEWLQQHFTDLGSCEHDEAFRADLLTCSAGFPQADWNGRTDGSSMNVNFYLGGGEASEGIKVKMDGKFDQFLLFANKLSGDL